jgi:hypothetical protein
VELQAWKCDDYAEDWMMHKQLIITRQDKKARQQQINVAKVTFFYC